MKKRFLLLFAAAVQGCTSLPVDVATSWSGVYEVVDKTLVATSTSPTGVALATEATGRTTSVTHMVEGNRIEARVGYGFGVIYRVPAELQDSFRAVVLIPAPGIPDQRTGKFVLRAEWAPNCSEGTCRAMYNFEHESELLPGTWRIELWRFGERLRSNEFTLAR